MTKNWELLIRRKFNSATCGLNEAIKVVGGESRLMRLIGNGTIREMSPRGKSQNSKWKLNKADVYLNME